MTTYHVNRKQNEFLITKKIEGLMYQLTGKFEEKKILLTICLGEYCQYHELNYSVFEPADGREHDYFNMCISRCVKRHITVNGSINALNIPQMMKQ